MTMCLGFTDTELFTKNAKLQDKDLLEVQKMEINRFPVQKYVEYKSFNQKNLSLLLFIFILFF